MRKSFHFILSGLFLLLQVLPLPAQFKSVYHLDVTDGLSQNTINTIYQDERHYLWIGTRNGLNLYNGKDFTLFRYDKDDPSGLSTNDIKLIDGDGRGHLFICTGYSQILRSDLATGEFKVLVPSRVTTMDYSGTDLYYACSHEIYRYPDGADAPELVYAFENPHNVVSALCHAGGKLYIGTTSKGVYVLEENGSLRQVFREGYVTGIMEDSRQEIWITFQAKYGILHLTADREEQFLQDPSDPHSLNSNKTQACCEDRDGNIWIGTFEGLARYDRQSRRITRYEHPILGDRSVITLMTDHQGTVWAGTYYLGLYHFNPSDQVYDIFTESSDGYVGLSSNIVGEMVEGEDGVIWIATEGGGVDAYNPSAGTFRRFGTAPAENVKTLHMDRNTLWAGTHLRGLERIDLKSGRIRSYRHVAGDPFSLPSDIVRDIIPYQDQLLLAVKGGVVTFDRATGRCRRFFEDDNYQNMTHYCSQLMLDSRDHLWLIHASNGVYRYDLARKEMTVYQSYANEDGHISPGRINHMLEDSRGRIWFCNNQNGLDRYDPSTDTFRNFDVRKDQLASNTVLAIAELSPDHFLISMDLGQSFFTCGEDGNIAKVESRIFPTLVANERSLLVSSSGRIYIGGANGMVSFRQGSFSRRRESFEVRPFRLFLDDHLIRPERGGVLEKDFSQVSRLEVGPSVSSISIEYACTDYRPYDKPELLYRLEGFSDQWHRMDESRVVTFLNLRPGKYRLVVKADGVPEEECAADVLALTVLPPFYRTTFAYLIYLLLALALGLYLAHLHNNRIRLQEAVKYEKYKLRFFTNISHEFRTPLSVIIAQIEMMMDAHHDDLSIYTPLRRVYRCCVQLKYLISELLDFRKQEQGYMKLKVRSADVVDFVHEQYLNFQVYARKKEISYRFVKPEQKIEAWFDPKQMQKVINNLIFNAFRHVRPDGEVKVTVRTDGRAVLVDVSNSGKGIPPQDIGKIFDRFYQIDSKDSVGAGTGIGLALSKGIVELHHGEIRVTSEQDGETVFTLSLPLGKAHFSEEELVTDEQPAVQFISDVPDEVYAVSLDLVTEETDIGEGQQQRHDCTVLVVDDNVELRNTLRQLFSPFYNVCVAENAMEALRILEQRSIDLIVSDVMMPGMDGVEFCRRVKTAERTSTLPVVLLTACAADCQKMAGMKYGADDYIVKPFNSREVIGRCNNLVNNRQLLKKKYAGMAASGPDGGKEPVLVNNTQDLDFIRRAREIVTDHLSDTGFRLENLAKELGVSRTKLFTRLKDTQGMTPMEFIMDIRLKEAARMLKSESRLNISEISEKTGFSSPKFLRKCFKEKYGMTPLEYRKS